MGNRQEFSSTLVTLLTMAGAAIGLGNVWRFPYMMGAYGGSAFLFIFLIFMLLFAVPAVIGEWALGRETRRGAVGAFVATVGPLYGRVIGYLLIFTVLVANSYYLVVIANVVFSGYFSTVYGFNHDTIPVFKALLQDGAVQYSIAVGLLLSALYIIYRGLNDGIEMVSKIFVPFFFFIILYLIFAVFSLPGAYGYMLKFLQPDFSLLNAKNVFAAMGQAFFSIGLGGTYILIYGSYMRSTVSLSKSAMVTAASDTSAALLASLFIIPTILVFGFDLTSGPQLIFVTLPHLFEQMPGGHLLGSLFLISLGMVAYLSSLAALEVIVGGISDDADKNTLTRNKVILLLVILETLLMIPSAFKPEIIGILDLFFGSAAQVLGSCLALLALTWGMGKKKTLLQVFGRVEGIVPNTYFFWIQWVVPTALIIVLVGFIVGVVSDG